MLSPGVDMLWVVIAASLVMSMQVGFCMLESGLVRSKNTINVAMKNFMDFTIATLFFWAFGFALMFGMSRFGLFGTTDFLFSTWATDQGHTFFLFQLMFCATAATIVSGAVAERMSFHGYLIVTVIVSGLIYPLGGHWVWNSDGWLQHIGFVDFAGSTVVHGTGAWVALAAVLILGPRIGRFSSKSAMSSSHSLGTATFGVLILFVGWIGFNGGSTLALSENVPGILTNTVLGGSAGAIAALLLAWKLSGVPELPRTLNGSIAGLVAVTANCNVTTPLAAIIIGAVGGMVCLGFEIFLERRQIDDVVGASAAHGASGVWGTLAVAFFGDPEKIGTGLGFWGQLGAQTVGVLAIGLWAGGIGWVLLKCVNRFVPLRVSADAERVGLNVAEHGASTEIIDLLSEMGRHRTLGEFTQVHQFDGFTEVGQIAAEYNQVIAKVVEEMELREGIATRLRAERETAQESNRQILSSIEYARRIQQAILPKPETLTETVGEHALIYRPRDLVSGDFYWCLREGNHTFVAVVDCTGHGVPGAFMSLVGHSLLQQIVAEKGILEPGEILSAMHQSVRDALRQDAPGSDNQDGMDVCLVRIDSDRIVFAGARRPLWWALADGTNGEIKGNRISIGGGRHEKRQASFDQHTLPRSAGLTLYLASDGYADQPNHLRLPFDTRQMRTLLKEISSQSMPAQTLALDQALDSHRGGAAQRDDITLLAIRLP